MVSNNKSMKNNYSIEIEDSVFINVDFIQISFENLRCFVNVRQRNKNLCSFIYRAKIKDIIDKKIHVDNAYTKHYNERITKTLQKFITYFKLKYGE